MNGGKMLRFLGFACVVALAGCASAPEPPPRLLVLVAVDQMRADYLQRFDPHFTGGFRRLLDEGRVFPNAIVDHAPTNSLPGHLTLASGAYPRRHGVVDNNWFDLETRRPVLGFSQPGCAPLGTAPSMHIPEVGAALFEAPTIVEWTLANPQARFASVGSGDGVSLLHAGRARGVVLWFQSAAGVYVSTTCAADALPGWVDVFNAQLSQSYMAQDWELTAPPAALGGLDPDASAYESGGANTAFPHRRPEDRLYEWFNFSPMIDAATLGLAEQAVHELDLGGDDVTDILTIGLSSLDHVGHRWGPDSTEQADTILRLDLELGELFAVLDREVGEGRWALALSADHGAPSAPEFAAARGAEGARRVREEDVAALIAAMAAAGDAAPAETRKAAAAEAARRFDFVERVISVDELETAAQSPNDAMLALYARSYRPGRVSLHPFYSVGRRSAAEFGLIVVTRPNVVVDWAASIHGSPHAYDRHVAMAFYGPGVRAGSDPSAVRTVDVAPTLAALAGVRPTHEIDGAVIDLGG